MLPTPYCPRCHSIVVVKSGHHHGKQRWLCQRCRADTSSPVQPHPLKPMIRGSRPRSICTAMDCRSGVSPGYSRPVPIRSSVGWSTMSIQPARNRWPGSGAAPAWSHDPRTWSTAPSPCLPICISTAVLTPASFASLSRRQKFEDG
jgi:hypothetical protein